MADQTGATAARGVPVASFASRPLAELARCFLEDNGVQALVDADDGNGTQPEVGFVTGGARVLVAPTEWDRARALLDEVERDAGPAETRPSRHRSSARWIAGSVAATMGVLGVWTTVVVLFF